MSAARLVAGILVAAVAIFALLWWRAAPEPAPSAPVPGAPAVAGDAAPLARPAAASAADARAPAAPTADAVPVEAMARVELDAHFRGLKLPAEVLDALAAGRVAEAAAMLDRATDGDSVVAASLLETLCAASLGTSTIEPAQVRTYGMGDPPAGTLAMLERTLDAQREWGRRFVQGCEQARLLRGGQVDATARRERLPRTLERLRRCADAGHAECLARLGELDRRDPQLRLQRLQSAAVLGSARAQWELIGLLENGPRASAPETVQAVRFWREALAKADPEQRAATLGCYDRDCDFRTLDREQARRELEQAAREGSVSALAMLGTSERTAAEQAAGSGQSIDVAQLPVVNPSETDAYAWRAVTERLALQGCLGFWPTWSAFVGGAAQAERALRPSQLDEARRLAERYWNAYGAGIAQRRGCGGGAAP